MDSDGVRLGQRLRLIAHTDASLVGEIGVVSWWGDDTVTLVIGRLTQRFNWSQVQRADEPWSPPLRGAAVRDEKLVNAFFGEIDQDKEPDKPLPSGNTRTLREVVVEVLANTLPEVSTAERLLEVFAFWLSTTPDPASKVFTD